MKKNRPVETLLKEKKEAKISLAKDIGISSKKPVLGILVDNELSKEMAAEVSQILHGSEALNIEIVVLADSNLSELSASTSILPYSRANRKKLLEAADMALAFEFSDVEELLLHGVIPISGAGEKVIDYNPTRETGNSFVYRKANSWGMFAALVRAVETFKFPYDWKHIVRSGVSSVVD